jgi:hypothetical protein
VRFELLETGQLASIASKGGRKNVETGHLASISSKGGKIAGRIAVETGRLASIATFETRSKGGRKGGKIGGRIQGNKNVESGHLANVRHIRWHVKRGIKKVGCSFCFPEAEL